MLYVMIYQLRKYPTKMDIPSYKACTPVNHIKVKLFFIFVLNIFGDASCAQSSSSHVHESNDGRQMDLHQDKWADVGNDLNTVASVWPSEMPTPDLGIDFAKQTTAVFPRNDIKSRNPLLGSKEGEVSGPAAGQGLARSKTSKAQVLLNSKQTNRMLTRRVKHLQSKDNIEHEPTFGMIYNQNSKDGAMPQLNARDIFSVETENYDMFLLDDNNQVHRNSQVQFINQNSFQVSKIDLGAEKNSDGNSHSLIENSSGNKNIYTSDYKEDNLDDEQFSKGNTQSVTSSSQSETSLSMTKPANHFLENHPNQYFPETRLPEEKSSRQNGYFSDSNKDETLGKSRRRKMREDVGRRGSQKRRNNSRKKQPSSPYSTAREELRTTMAFNPKANQLHGSYANEKKTSSGLKENPPFGEMESSLSGFRRPCHLWQTECADGKCIDADNYCDGVVHCDDYSDELPGCTGKTLSLRLHLCVLQTNNLYLQYNFSSIDLFVGI